MSDDLFRWVPIAISVLALAVATFSLAYTARNFGINRRKELRERPSVTVYSHKGRRRQIAQRDLFEFSVSLSNMAATPNSIRGAELRFVCHRDGLKLPVVVEHVSSSAARHDTSLDFPLQVGPGQTVSGVVSFEVDENVILKARLSDFKVTFLTTHGAAPSFETVVLLNERFMSEVGASAEK